MSSTKAVDKDCTSEKKRPDGSELVSDKLLQNLSRQLMVETEFERITSVLRADPARRTGKDPLIKRRNDLIRQVAASLPRQVALPDRHEKVLTTVVDHLFPWRQLYLPYMYDGINVRPRIDEDEGSIGGTGYGGRASFGLQLYDYGDTPVEKWWIRNWRNSVIFPRAPNSGLLEYRFTASGMCNIYRAPVYSGSINAFATIGSTGNAASNPVDKWGNFHTVGWTLLGGLPMEDFSQFFGWVPVSGSIPVEAGNSAALGFIYGLIVSFASGYVTGWGNLSTSRTVPPGTPDDYTLYGMIEYRFVPAWLDGGVRQWALSPPD